MAPKLALTVVALAVLLSGVRATTLTLNDYDKFKDGSAKYNPPTCALPYDSLDLSRITAWSDITSDKDPQCGSCANVCGSAGCEYLLIVDQCTWGADHLDISTLAGNKIVGSDTGNHVVTMELVDVKNCASIWSGKMFNSWDEPNQNLKALQALQGGAVYAPGASSAPATSAAAAAYTTPASSSAAAYSPPSVPSTPVVYSTPAAYSSSAVVPTPAPSSSVQATPTSAPAPYSSPAPDTSSQSSNVAYTPSAYTPSAYAPSSSSSSSSSPSSVETPTSYVSSTSTVEAVSTTSSSTLASSAVTGYASSAITTPYISAASTLVSVYSSYVPSNSIAGPVPTSNATVPHTSATPSPIPYTGAGVKTTMSLSGLAMSCLLVAMVVLA